MTYPTIVNQAIHFCKFSRHSTLPQIHMRTLQIHAIFQDSIGLSMFFILAIIIYQLLI